MAVALATGQAQQGSHSDVPTLGNPRVPGLVWKRARIAAECPFAMSMGQGPLGGSRSRPYRGKVVGLVLRTALLLVEYTT